MAGNQNGISYGPVFDEDTHQIKLPDGNTVDVLRYITEGIESKAQTAAQSRYKLAQRQAAGRGKKADISVMSGAEFFFDNGAYRLSLLQQMIKAWSFIDAKGVAIPVKPETIARLPVHTREIIMEAIDEFNPVASDEESEDLEVNSETSLPVTVDAPEDSPTPI